MKRLPKHAAGGEADDLRWEADRGEHPSHFFVHLLRFLLSMVQQNLDLFSKPNFFTRQVSVAPPKNTTVLINQVGRWRCANPISSHGNVLGIKNVRNFEAELLVESFCAGSVVTDIDRNDGKTVVFQLAV